MTLEVLNETIRGLIVKRQEAHGDKEKQDKYNKMLTKLYEMKYLMLEQVNRSLMICAEHF